MKEERNIIHPIVNTRTLQSKMTIKELVTIKSSKVREIGPYTKKKGQFDSGKAKV